MKKVLRNFLRRPRKRIGIRLRTRSRVIIRYASKNGIKCTDLKLAPVDFNGWPKEKKEDYVKRACKYLAYRKQLEADNR